MLNKLTYVVLFAIIFGGCGLRSEKTIVDGEGESERMMSTLSVEPLVGNPDPAVVVLTSQDGEVQEEVVYLDAESQMPAEAEVTEIPAIIAAALADAPEGVINLAGEATAPVNVLLESDGGAIQEEVIYTDSDTVVDEESDDHQAAHAPIIVAAL